MAIPPQLGPGSPGSTHLWVHAAHAPSMPWVEWYLPCQVQAPQKNHQLQCQVGHEEGVIAFPHTVLHPGAVMVIAADTAATITTVSGPQGLLWAQRGMRTRVTA